MFRLLVLILLAACDEDDGPNSAACVEQRMYWLEMGYLKQRAIDQGDVDLARRRQTLQDQIVSANMRCFPGFTLHP